MAKYTEEDSSYEKWESHGVSSRLFTSVLYSSLLSFGKLLSWVRGDHVVVAGIVVAVAAMSKTATTNDFRNCAYHVTMSERRLYEEHSHCMPYTNKVMTRRVLGSCVFRLASELSLASKLL